MAQNLARNRTFTGNVIYSPSAYLLFSLEYRRLESSRSRDSRLKATSSALARGTSSDEHVRAIDGLAALRFSHRAVADQCAGSDCRRNQSAEVRLRVVSSLPGDHRAVPAVVWLEPLPGTPALSFFHRGTTRLLQKNRMFIPHLQVIPVGSVVQFPNADPFFHNVFSLFEGKRFDLGLYEAGSSKSVTFRARESPISSAISIRR